MGTHRWEAVRTGEELELLSARETLCTSNDSQMMVMKLNSFNSHQRIRDTVAVPCEWFRANQTQIKGGRGGTFFEYVRMIHVLFAMTVLELTLS